MTLPTVGPPAVRRRRAAGLFAVLLAGLALPVSGCGDTCTKTALHVRPVDVSDPHAPLTISARLTRDGKPFDGVEVKLAVNLLGANNAHADALFRARTDADGVATVTREEGVAGLSVPNQQVTGYAAYYQPLNKVNGTQYCWSGASAPLTCGAGPCQRADPFPAPSSTG